MRHNNPGLRYLIDFWSKYCVLEKWHVEWARTHIRVPIGLHKGDPLYLEGEPQKIVYLVARGLLGRVQDSIPPDDESHPMKRQIVSIATPGMALMTTHHLYSDTPSKGDIVVMRPDTLVIEIPYMAIKIFKEQESPVDTLIDILGNKKKKQLVQLRLATHGLKPFESYLYFAEEMPELQRTLTNQEAADLLGISVDTVYRAKRMRINR